MNMNAAIERAQDALLGYDQWCVGTSSYLRPTDPREWAAIVRDLLAVAPGAPGTWAWVCEQMRQGREVRRASWTHEDQIHTAGGVLRFVVGKENFVVMLSDFDATDWEVVPPPAPAIEPGTRVWWWRYRNEECQHDEEGTGTYEKANPSRGWYPHSVSVSNCIRDFGVDRVEPLRTDGDGGVT